MAFVCVCVLQCLQAALKKMSLKHRLNPFTSGSKMEAFELEQVGS